MSVCRVERLEARRGERRGAGGSCTRAAPALYRTVVHKANDGKEISVASDSIAVGNGPKPLTESKPTKLR